jgi:hypothetical protein
MRLNNRQARELGIVPEPPKDPTARQKRQADRQARENLIDAYCDARGLPRPIYEYEFHPERKWRLDLLFDGWLGLEIEGGVFGTGKPCPTCGRRKVGAHSSVENMKRDVEKYNEAQILGYVVLRCLPEDVDSGAVFALVERALLEGDHS